KITANKHDVFVACKIFDFAVQETLKPEGFGTRIEDSYASFFQFQKPVKSLITPQTPSVCWLRFLKAEGFCEHVKKKFPIFYCHKIPQNSKNFGACKNSLNFYGCGITFRKHQKP
ncbi:hypothetical protein, partial [Methanobacterium bryantii]|uniref:hypothetical protein n=1 Tax=Methanobacterium bryantii TaxID=2161 RepID=UPI001C52B602